MRRASWLLVIPIVLALAVGVAVFAVGARAVDRGFDVIEYRQQSPYYQALALRDATMQDGGGFSWGRLFLMVAAVLHGGVAQGQRLVVGGLLAVLDDIEAAVDRPRADRKDGQADAQSQNDGDDE